jgi:hypothetical protein
MSTELEKRPVAPDWGEAGKGRGLSNLQLALDFIDRFPIGTKVSVKEFDAWGASRGAFKLPSEEDAKDKNSDPWKAHLMRRHELRHRINLASKHPRLRDTHGKTPYSFDTVVAGQWYEVRPPFQAAVQSEIPKRVSTYLNTQYKKLSFLMQSEDWDALTEWHRSVAETLFEDIEAFQAHVQLHSKTLQRKFNKLTADLRRGIERGDIKPRNGGIKQLSLLDPDAIADDDFNKTG